MSDQIKSLAFEMAKKGAEEEDFEHALLLDGGQAILKLLGRVEELEQDHADYVATHGYADSLVLEFKQRIEELEAEKIMLLATVAMLQGDREVTDSEC